MTDQTVPPTTLPAVRLPAARQHLVRSVVVSQSDALDGPPAWLVESLVRCGIVESVDAIDGAEPLTGGVSSDVWKVRCRDRVLCAKRALPQLKVAGDWRAPTTRSRWETAWLRRAGTIAPDAVPAVLGADDVGGVVMLEWLEPDLHPVWKTELLAGTVDMDAAAQVGVRLAAFHSAMTADTAAFEPARPLFEDLRIAPYLRVTAAAHPDLAATIGSHADALAAASVTVIHGDVSPKNILIGPAGPVLLDAECASPGDPAFDVAFCVNHLLLKAAHLPAHATELTRAATALVEGHCAAVDWEPAAALESRVAALTPILALARVDGLSPVEYLTEPARRAVRAAARQLVDDPPATWPVLVERWLDATAPDPESTRDPGSAPDPRSSS